MEPFRLCLALGPVAIYLVLMGMLNLSRRSFLVSGTRDAAALALAVSGLLIVGPVELFFPEKRTGPPATLGRSAADRILYRLVWTLAGPGALDAAAAIGHLQHRRRSVATHPGRDGRAARHGGSLGRRQLGMPGLGVELHVDNHAAMRNVSLVSLGPHQDYAGWRRLERELAAALAQVEVRRNPPRLWPIEHGHIDAGGAGRGHCPRPAGHRPRAV